MSTEQMEEVRAVVVWLEDRQRRHLDDADVPITAIAGEYLRQRKASGQRPALNETSVTAIIARYDQHGHPRPRCL